MSSRSYKDAVERLNSLQSNAATLEALRASGGRSSAFAIPEMLEYLNGIGYRPTDLNALNVIHITGTKGKGSTSAFTDSILRHARPHWDIGLYTSPHLVAVRERIRINGSPLSEEEFATYFFEVWDKIENDFKPKMETTPLKPGYFRFMTLLAFHVFLQKKVNATILEVGVGGTYDSTNLVPTPVVTGITALGLDHTTVLGKTLAEIAWQKSGIFKQGVPAFSVTQPPEGMEVIERRAKELKASSFSVVEESPPISKMSLGLAGAHQVQNASLAVALSQSFLSAHGDVATGSELPSHFVEGLQSAKWPGRCQTVPDPSSSATHWYLDGAHTKESLVCCLEWFVHPGVGLSRPGQPISRVLIFNCTSGRSGASFLDTIFQQSKSLFEKHSDPSDAETFFDQVLFCTNATYADGNFKGDLTAVGIHPSELTHFTVQHELADIWRLMNPSFPEANIHVLGSIEHAVQFVRNHVAQLDERTPVKVLVTGSLHLVGGVIEVAGLADFAL